MKVTLFTKKKYIPNGNIEGLLCYIGFWVTGIIFLFHKKKARFIRFHAMQSLVMFGIFNMILGITGSYIGWNWNLVWGTGQTLSPVFLAAVTVFIVFSIFWWILWAILMYKAYHNQIYRIPGFSGLADWFLTMLDRGISSVWIPGCRARSNQR